MIAAILLIPTKGDPHGLLKEGPCGARPPMARLESADMHEPVYPSPCGYSCDLEDASGAGGCKSGGACQRTLTQECSWCGESWPCSDAGTVANPERWRGLASYGYTPLPKGEALVLAWDGEPGDEVQPYIERAGIDYALLAPFVTYALKGMDIGQGPWPGTLVLLDAEGREVKDSPATGPQQEKTP